MMLPKLQADVWREEFHKGMQYIGGGGMGNKHEINLKCDMFTTWSNWALPSRWDIPVVLYRIIKYK